MDSLKRRNPPETSKTAKFNAEIRHSPYRGVKVEGSFLESAAMPDLLGLAQQAKLAPGQARRRRAGGVAFMACDCREVLREINQLKGKQ